LFWARYKKRDFPDFPGNSPKGRPPNRRKDQFEKTWTCLWTDCNWSWSIEM